jgi:glycosyltransferase involved in cell wall biosynthesis
MLIGFDAKRYFLNRTGLGNYARNTVRALEKFHPENQYFLYTPKTGENSHLPGSKTIVRTPGSEQGRLGSALWRTFSLSRIIKKDNLDIYHGLSHELPLGIKKAGCRTAVTVHDLIFMRMPGLYSPIDARIYKKKYKRSCHAADVVVAISKSTKNDLLEFFHIPEEKIRVAYQSCDPIFFNKSGPKELDKTRQKYSLPGEFILYLGSLVPRKNIHNLIHALGSMGKKNAPCLILAGQGKKDYIRQAMHIARQNKIEDNIRHLPGIPSSDLPCLYQAAQLFIYPSVYEGFGIPVLEALASGTPVITSDNSCLREAGGPGSRYIDPSSPEDMARAISEILEDGQLRQEMIREGEKHAGNFTPQKTAEGLMHIYRELGA